MAERLKVLVSAYACSPYQGSEPAVGWGFVTAMSKYHDLWVLVEEEKFRDEIEKYIQENSTVLQSVKFIFLHKKRNRFLRRLWPPSYYWYYRQWHKDALVCAKQLNSQIDFDLVHQLTMVGFREPGYLWKLDIPFVWGPVGGMGFFPSRFLPTLGVYGTCYYAAYNVYNLLQMCFLKRPRIAAKKAGVGLFFATLENAREAAKYWSVNGSVITEVGLPENPMSQIRVRTKGEPFRIIWTGLHVPRKALNLALEAVSRLPSSIDWELHILGTGQKSLGWEKLAKNLNISSRCRFYGWLPRAEALEVMKDSHLMLITSLRDLTSTVTVEALAFGLPIVCMDHCGFSFVVDKSCGLKVPVHRPRETISSMTTALTQLEENEDMRQLLAAGALKRAEKFSWAEKGMILDKIYRKKINADVESRKTET